LKTCAGVTLQAGRDARGIFRYINRPDPGGSATCGKYRNYGSALRLLHQYNLFPAGRTLYKGLNKHAEEAANYFPADG